MAQKKKSQAKVKSASAAAKAVKKPAVKATKAAAVKKAAKPVKAGAAKSSAPARKSPPVAAKAAAKPARAPEKASPAKAEAAHAKAAPVKAKVAEARPAKPAAATAKITPARAAHPTPAKTEARADAHRKPAAAPAAPAQVAAAATKQPQRAVPAAVATQAKERISAPVSARAPAGAPKAGEAKSAAAPAKTAEPRPAAEKKPVGQRHGFKMNEHVVYPAHGVGKIIGIEEQEIAGMSLELFVITFEKEKLTLRVPTGKLEAVGMRKLAEENTVSKAMETLKGRARVKRTMWSRRAQEYVAKINSGDLVSIAEVVRDLYRSEAQPEQSYSERQLYEDALDRMAREIAAVEKLDDRGAVQRITDVLSKSAKGRRAAAEDAEAEAA